MILVIVAIVTVPSSVLQVSYTQSDLANTVLAVHNRERAAVGVAPLVWSDELAAGAKTWAEHLVTTGTFAYDTAIAPKGENIAQARGAGFHSEQLMQIWVNEKKNWNGAPVTDKNLYPIGNYVQMISPASKAVGCATASSGGTVDLVCRYDRSLFPQEPYIPSFMSRPAQAVGEDAGVPPLDQAVGNDDGGGGDGDAN